MIGRLSPWPRNPGQSVSGSSYPRAGPPMNAEGLVAAFVLPPDLPVRRPRGDGLNAQRMGRQSWMGRTIFPRGWCYQRGHLGRRPLAAMEFHSSPAEHQQPCTRSIVLCLRRRNRVHLGHARRPATPTRPVAARDSGRRGSPRPSQGCPLGRRWTDCARSRARRHPPHRPGQPPDGGPHHPARRGADIQGGTPTGGTAVGYPYRVPRPRY
jgi:hypothetical protein